MIPGMTVRQQQYIEMQSQAPRNATQKEMTAYLKWLGYHKYPKLDIQEASKMIDDFDNKDADLTERMAEEFFGKDRFK